MTPPRRLLGGRVVPTPSYGRPFWIRRGGGSLLAVQECDTCHVLIVGTESARHDHTAWHTEVVDAYQLGYQHGQLAAGRRRRAVR